MTDLAKDSTKEDGKEDENEVTKCLYIPQLLSKTAPNVPDARSKEDTSTKKTSKFACKEGNGSLYSETTFSTSVSFRENTNQDSKMCRICYGGDSTFDKLISPCICSGSTKYTHETCLLHWITFKGSKTCELCHYTMEIHCNGFKPFWKWQKPKSCDAVTTLSILYSIVMFMFLAMVMWIAKNQCISAICITLYCLCLVAVAYFCYCCGYLHCLKPYCRAFWDINRRWSVVGRRISSDNQVSYADSEV